MAEIHLRIDHILTLTWWKSSVSFGCKSSHFEICSHWGVLEVSSSFWPKKTRHSVGVWFHQFWHHRNIWFDSCSLYLGDFDMIAGDAIFFLRIKHSSIFQEDHAMPGKLILSKNMVAQLVKSLPAMQETWVWSLGEEDPLEKEMATQSSILAWEIPWTEEPGGLQSMGLGRVRHNCVSGHTQEDSED